ncbi:PGF-CTERM sorting domain-containing protein [Natronomonas salina]|uniref:PGF-CTERM sorting domain-containing protein n=1 Tax=Natronomonas salina TaxID=1710540 RepID=UPI0015B3AA8F|nr:PGF-CTERM sorting domain-containing protein [Natronomonas salina]QLD88375.1 PGF-CTERM sorting domain-containing protein [Natronomonas salina]
MTRSVYFRHALLIVGLCLLVAGAAIAFGGGGSGSSIASAHEGHNDSEHGSSVNSSAVSEQRYVEEAPEEGDEYFEAKAEDGSWISYDNPRDRYRDPMIGNASGKICVTLRNEAGEVVVGESVPDTSVTIPTPSLPWHSYADPMVVEFPMTDHYDRPLDSDQFGTSDDLPQGDGYMDAHCIEYHGPPDNKTIEYGEAIVDGEHADRVEVVGYIQQAHEAWDSDVDAIEDAVSYEEAGGEWTMETGQSHGQVTVVLQLDGIGQQSETGGDEQNQTNATDTSPTETNGTETSDDRATDDDGSSGPMDQTAPGAGAVLVALIASLAALYRERGA